MCPNPIKTYEYLQVTQGVGIRRDDRILDVGCGKGHWTADLAMRAAEAVGVDTSERKVAFARKSIRFSGLRRTLTFLCGRLEDLGFPSDHFDHVFSFCVLEHVPDLAGLLVEARRVLKPGGSLHVSADSLATIRDPGIVEKHRRDHGVVEYFSET